MSHRDDHTPESYAAAKRALEASGLGVVEEKFWPVEKTRRERGPYWCTTLRRDVPISEAASIAAAITALAIECCGHFSFGTFQDKATFMVFATRDLVEGEEPPVIAPPVAVDHVADDPGVL